MLNYTLINERVSHSLCFGGWLLIFLFLSEVIWWLVWGWNQVMDLARRVVSCWLKEWQSQFFKWSCGLSIRASWRAFACDIFGKMHKRALLWTFSSCRYLGNAQCNTGYALMSSHHFMWKQKEIKKTFLTLYTPILVYVSSILLSILRVHTPVVQKPIKLSLD